MEPQAGLHSIDWIVLLGYLAFALGVGLFVRELAESDKESYFLAGRSLPWWWAGASIAATTFAADTPLVVTGETAARGLSGNWLWLAWIGVHAAAFVFFAAKWSKSGVLTDAELVDKRYSGTEARVLRTTRALVYGVLVNALILGWVLSAMVMIAEPFFHWDQWFPMAYDAVASWWPEETAMGDPSDGMTILFLLALVGLYSTLGGIRGVIVTDLVQLTIGLVASFWFAWVAWNEIGGRSGMMEGLDEHYDDPAEYLSLFPELTVDWFGEGQWAGLDILAEMPVVLATVFGAYLMVQAFANFPADGGGYFMQRLNTCKSPQDASQASLFFIILNYIVRTGPWFIVAVAALVLIPLGAESEVLGSASGLMVDGDDVNREMAYPVLMDQLLIPGMLGLLLTSLLAAFMSTIDTHINWGASYLVNDLFLWLNPEASSQQVVYVARCCVVGFVVLAVVVTFQIDTIGQAWRWVASIGAALGIPTALRWLWWRVNASAELGAIGFGLAVAFGLVVTDIPFEIELVLISGASLIGMILGMVFGPSSSDEVLMSFMNDVEPDGVWPDRSLGDGLLQIAGRGAIWIAIVGGTIATLAGLHQWVLLGNTASGLLTTAAGSGGLWAGTWVLSDDSDANVSSGPSAPSDSNPPQQGAP